MRALHPAWMHSQEAGAKGAAMQRGAGARGGRQQYRGVPATYTSTRGPSNSSGAWRYSAARSWSDSCGRM